MSYEATGKVDAIGPVQQVSEKFRKRNLVLLVPGEREQFLQFELLQDRVSLADSLQIGDTVQVKFDLEGRKWKESVFNTLKAWQVTVLDTQLPDYAAPENEGLPF